MRYIFNDFGTDYQDLAGSNGGIRWITDAKRNLYIVFKALNKQLPSYITSMFKLRDNIKNLRGTNKLVLPRVNTTRYGLKSTIYVARKEWNALPDEIRNNIVWNDYKTAIKNFKIA